jgi:hypothetical protein
MGYYAILLGLRYQASSELIQRLDANAYNSQETFTLEVPLTVPYFNGPEEFNRVDGEFDFDGDTYRLVKQRISNDTLYVVYIKDKKSSKIKQAISELVKTFTDKPADSKQIKVNSFIKDYLISKVSLVSENSGWFTSIHFSQSEINRTVPYLSITSPPPKA